MNREVRLSEVCQIQPPKTEVRSRLKGTDSVTFAPMETLGIGRKTLEGTTERQLADVAGSYTYFAENDVLLAKITPCFENGKLGIASNLINGAGFGSSEYIVFRPTQALIPEYLYYYLLQDSFRTVGSKHMTGTAGQKRITRTYVESRMIRLPSHKEQARIVVVLNEAFEGISYAEANTQRNLNSSRDFFDSGLESRLADSSSGWAKRSLSELCEFKHGFAFKSEHFHTEGNYVLLTPGNFYEHGGFRERGDKQKYYGGDFPREFLLAPGDLLVAMTEQAAGLLGSPIIVPEFGHFLHNQRLGLVKSRPDVPWLNRFFFYAFNTKTFRKAVHDGASGVKVRHTSPTKLGEVSVSFPLSLEVQQAVVTEMEEAYSDTLRLQAIYNKKLLALNQLRQSLLYQAFSGNL